LIIKKDHDVKASKIKKAQTPQQIKHEEYKKWLAQPKTTRGKFPSVKPGERLG